MIGLCVYCGKTLDSKSDNFCSKTCSHLHDIIDSLQNIIFCVGILKKEFNSKSNKKMNNLIEILEKNSFNISEHIKNLRS